LPVVVAERLPRGCLLRFHRGCRMVVLFDEVSGCRTVAGGVGNRQETVTTAVDGCRRLSMVVALKLSVIACSGDRLCLPLLAPAEQTYCAEAGGEFAGRIAIRLLCSHALTLHSV
jgi:hypothetical protein